MVESTRCAKSMIGGQCNAVQSTVTDLFCSSSWSLARKAGSASEFGNRWKIYEPNSRQFFRWIIRKTRNNITITYSKVIEKKIVEQPTMTINYDGLSWINVAFFNSRHFSSSLSHFFVISTKNATNFYLFAKFNFFDQQNTWKKNSRNKIITFEWCKLSLFCVRN